MTTEQILELLTGAEIVKVVFPVWCLTVFFKKNDTIYRLEVDTKNQDGWDQFQLKVWENGKPD